MNELATPARRTPARHKTLRWQLLATASAIAFAAGATEALAHQDSDRPTVWIELGGQLERIDTEQSPFAPPFMTKSPTPEPFKNGGSPIAAQRPARYAIGGEAKITFTPADTDWVFSAGVRYGRASSKRDISHQTAFETLSPNPKYILSPIDHPTKFIPYTAARLSFDQTHDQESYAILDFQVGKDVGLGRLGSSQISAGVRYAAFTSKSDAQITARPTATVVVGGKFPIGPGVDFPSTQHNEFTLSGQSSRSFSGVGPALAWSGSTPVLGRADEGEVSVDWGADAAVLFGRQKAKGTHHTSGTHYFRGVSGLAGGYPKVVTPLYPSKNGSFDRSRSVVVPNIGAFAGLSVRYSDAKVSFGYRADYFFGAMDVGIDARETSTRGFHGPFAKISIGLGG